MSLTDESPFPYGLYQGVKMQEVPADYLIRRFELLSKIPYRVSAIERDVMQYVSENRYILELQQLAENKYKKTL